MRLLVVGKLNGQLSLAVKMAMNTGAKVAHVETISAATQALRPAGKGRWQIELELPAGKQEFKIGDADWRVVDLGGDGSDALRPAAWQPLRPRGANLLLDLPSAGRYRLELELDDSPRPARLRLLKR